MPEEDLEVWVVGSDKRIHSCNSEEDAARMAERYDGIAIYFFASLVA